LQQVYLFDTVLKITDNYLIGSKTSGMITFNSFVLNNGLKVIVHEDLSTPTAVVNILYNVGSKDEQEDKTGFAHLFEHLMFGGSKYIKSFDEPLEKVGGENNAFTSPDITNYYITLPANNIETAFWLESDRMLGLSFDPKVLEVQRSVVIEEFKQRYLNQPYGDIWLKLRPLSYQVHPYKWATIGKEISHIEKATMEDVKAFFYKYYIPNNAILVVAGGVKTEEVKQLAEKWFGPIPAGETYHRDLPQEPVQTEARKLEVQAQVPLNAWYRTYNMCSRSDADFWPTDLLSDILGRGKSSRLYEKLVKQKEIFNSISASTLGSYEPGLLVIGGKLNDGYTIEQGEEAVEEIIQELLSETISETELQKVKNQAESVHIFDEVELANKALNLAIATLLGDTNMANKEAELINSVSIEDVERLKRTIFRKENSNTLYYRKTN
jgi:zinc protease